MTDAATASSRTMKGRNMVVVFFSRAGENYEVGEVTVGNTAKLAQEVARRTDSPMIEIARTEPYPERYAATSEMVQEEQRVNARPLFTLSGDVDALDSSDTVFLGYPDLVRRYADARVRFSGKPRLVRQNHLSVLHARRQRAWTDSGTYHRNHQGDGEAGACGHGDRRTEQRK